MPKQEDYLDAITDILNKFGVRGLTMEQIAAKIGVTKRTLYNNFGTKDELVKAVIDHKFGIVRAKMVELASNPRKNAINVNLEVMMHSIKSWNDASIIFLQSLNQTLPEIYLYMTQNSQRMMNEFFALNIPRGRSEELYRTDFDIDILAAFAHISMSNFLEFCVNDSASSLEQKKEMLLQIVTILTRGVLTPKGAELLDMEIPKIRKQVLEVE